MIRPQTANPSKISSILNKAAPKKIFNESSNKIIDNFNQKGQDQNNEWQQQSMNEVKTENPKGHAIKQLNKHNVALMLMKFELDKMGFKKKLYENIIEKFVKEANLQGTKPTNLRQWVLKQKSTLVDLLIQKKQEDLELQIESQPGYNQKLQKIEPIVPKLIPIRQKNHIDAQESQIKQQKIDRPVIKIKQQPKIQQIPQQKRQKSDTRVCPICLEETRYYIQRKCGHIFCQNCIRSYLLESMQSGNFILDCPEIDCPQKVSQAEAATVLNSRQLNRFVKFKEKIELQNNPNNKFCNRPDCGQLLKEIKDKKLFCKACNITFCPTCQEPDHTGRECGEILQQSMDQTYKNFNIKKCPNCLSPIQKMDGCNHMTCKKCKAQFCWICLGKYTPYHYRIYNCCGCPGLQYDQPQSLTFKRFLQVLFFIFLPLLIALTIAAILLVLPLFMLFDFITKPCKWIREDQKCQMAVMKVICCFLPDCLVCFLGYFVFLVRSALYCVFVSPIDYFGVIVNIAANIL